MTIGESTAAETNKNKKGDNSIGALYQISPTKTKNQEKLKQRTNKGINYIHPLLCQPICYLISRSIHMPGIHLK